jgi:predicted nucleotidyltransferase
MSAKNQTRILLRLPSALHKRAKARASETGESLNSVFVQAIENGLSNGQLETLTPSIIKYANSQFGEAFLGLLLYGSRARGDAYESSDTDLLLVVNGSVRITRELYHSWDAILQDGISLNIAALPATAREAGSLWFECALDAKIVFDPTGILRRRLDEIKEMIVSGAVVRRTTHGQGYWIAT